MPSEAGDGVWLGSTWTSVAWMTNPAKHRCAGTWNDPDDGRPQHCVRSVYSHFDPNITRRQTWQFCDECHAFGRVPEIINPMPPIREWVRPE